jgi:hypothetical protein
MRQGFQPLSDWEFDLKLTPMDNTLAPRVWCMQLRIAIDEVPAQNRERLVYCVI